MKTKIIILAMLLVSILSVPVSAKENTSGESVKRELKYVKTTDPEVLKNRLTEIEEISRKELSSEQKKELREETKEIRSVLREASGGVYLSAGAILLIALVLIILL